MTRLFLGAALMALAMATIAPAQTAAPDGLQPGDVINLRIWREADMSGQFMVQEDGVAVLPRLGPVVVVGKEPEVLKRELIEEYSKTLRNPSIEVIFQRRVTITGEVRTPGLFPVDPTMSLTDALALAGGATPTANREKVILIRGGERTEFDVEEALTVEDLSLRSGDQLFVPQRGWFSRNWPLAASILGVALSVAAFAMR
jgi:polysaccharide export outer membrane protein